MKRINLAIDGKSSTSHLLKIVRRKDYASGMKDITAEFRFANITDVLYNVPLVGKSLSYIGGYVDGAIIAFAGKLYISPVFDSRLLNRAQNHCNAVLKNSTNHSRMPISTKEFERWKERYPMYSLVSCEFEESFAKFSRRDLAKKLVCDDLSEFSKRFLREQIRLTISADFVPYMWNKMYFSPVHGWDLDVSQVNSSIKEDRSDSVSPLSVFVSSDYRYASKPNLRGLKFHISPHCYAWKEDSDLGLLITPKVR